MKRLFNKLILISTAIVISFLVVYGIAYTQQVCCNDVAAVCFQAPNRILGGSTASKSWTNSQAYGANILLRSSLGFKNNFDSGNACRETDSCDFYKQSVYISLSSAQNLYPLQDGSTTFEIDMNGQSSYDPQILSTSLEPEPIYILTKSILCWFLPNTAGADIRPGSKFNAYSTFVIFAVCIDESGAEAVRPFMEKYKLSFRPPVDPEGNIKIMYRTTGVPETFIIDKDGKIAEEIIGSRDWAAPGAIRFFRSLIRK